MASKRTVRKAVELAEYYEGLGGYQHALDQQQDLFAEGGQQGVSDNSGYSFVGQPDPYLGDVSDDGDSPVEDQSAAGVEMNTFQHPDMIPPAQSTATRQRAFPTFTTPSLADPSNNKFPEVSNSRPGAHERRNDGEPPVYRELPSFPSFDENIPAEASLEDICIQYPNHLRGSYLDAFLQWRWTAADIFTHLSDKARDEFRACGISRTKSYNNRANFLMKRLSARMNEYNNETMTALCKAPKLRGCLIGGGELYGHSSLQGKFHNPSARAIRSFPQRQNQARKARASALAAAKVTFILNGREFRLWSATDELDKFKRSMAMSWERQRTQAEQIIAADAIYRMAEDSRRNQLSLQITNWPVNSSTATFFSFNQVDECPTFVSAINDMVAASVVDLLDCSANTNIGAQLALARRSAIQHVLSAQEARLAMLQGLVATLPSGYFFAGVVDHALSGVEGPVHGFASSTDEQYLSQTPVAGSIPISQGNVELFAAGGNVAPGLAPPFQARAVPRYPMGGNSAVSQNSLGHGMTTNSYPTNSNPTQHQHRANSLRPILPKPTREAQPQQVGTSKRARDESTEPANSMKRARVSQPDVPQGHNLMDAGVRPGTAFNFAGNADPFEDRSSNPSIEPFFVGHATVPDLPSISGDLDMVNWQVLENMPNTWDTLLADANMDGTDFDMTDISIHGAMPQQTGPSMDFPQQAGYVIDLPDAGEESESAPAISGTDIFFTTEPSMEDLYDDFNVEALMGGIDETSNAESTVMVGVEDMAEGGADSEGLAATDAVSALWELPVMEDNDPQWLRDLYGPGV